MLKPTKFSFSKKDAVEIFASEIVGQAVGLPGAGTATSFAVKTIANLLDNTAEIRLPDRAQSAPDDFLNQHPLSLQGLYDRESLLGGRLLYVEEACFIDQLIETQSVEIEILPDFSPFELTPMAEPETEALRQIGFERLREVGKYRHDSDVIRTNRIERTPNGARLHIQKANYSQQAKSNLILDFRPDTSALSLRQSLAKDTPGFLPALNDGRLVNSLGVNILVFYRNEEHIWTPFLVPRTRKVAVLNRGMWSDSASGAAEWPPNPDTTEATFREYILDDLHQEMESEIGLFPQDMITILPMAIGRELIRAGKPQVFFIGFTWLNRSELLEKMETARQKNLKNPIEPEEIFRMPVFRKPPNALLSDDISATYETRMVDPQCAASLFYAKQFLERMKDAPIWSSLR